MPRQSRQAGVTSMGSLYGQALMCLSAAVGVHQAGLARYLGLTRMQVNQWARGREPIPPGHLLLITKRLQEATQHTLARPEGPSKSALAAILNDVFAENLAALGFPPYPTLRVLLDHLTAASAAFGATTDPTPAQHAELKTLAGALNFCTLIINDLLELFGLLDCPQLAFLSGAKEDVYADTCPRQDPGSGDERDAHGALPGPQRTHDQLLDAEESRTVSRKGADHHQPEDVF